MRNLYFKLTSRGDTVKRNLSVKMKVFIYLIVGLLTFFLTWMGIYYSLSTWYLLIAYSIVAWFFILMVKPFKNWEYVLNYQLIAENYIHRQDGLEKQKSFTENNGMAKKLTHAINNELIDIYFQKIIDTKSNSILYVEQLARWNDADFGSIEPETFFEVASHSKQLFKLEYYLINKSIKQYKAYCMNSYEKPQLALNLTPEIFLHKDTVKYLESCLKKHHINASKVCVEISENMFINDHELCIKQIKRYKEFGFSIALDDFGKSYSSLGLLENIEYDVIKIDRMFTNTIHKEQTQEIIKMIQKIAHMASKTIIVEGVEKEMQQYHLHKLNCYTMQGFWLHRPEKM